MKLLIVNKKIPAYSMYIHHQSIKEFFWNKPIDQYLVLLPNDKPIKLNDSDMVQIVDIAVAEYLLDLEK